MYHYILSVGSYIVDGEGDFDTEEQARKWGEDQRKRYGDDSLELDVSDCPMGCPCRAGDKVYCG